MKLTKSQIETLENLRHWWREDPARPWAEAGNHFRGLSAPSANALVRRGMACKRGGIGRSPIEFKITESGLDALRETEAERALATP